LEEKFKEKRMREEPEVIGGFSAVQEETLVAKRRSQVEPNKPESSQVIVDQLQLSPDGPTTNTTNIINTTSTSYTSPDGFTQTSVETSQMSSERGTAEVTSAGDSIQGEQQTSMLMGQGTHESTSQSQQVEEQPSALSRDQDDICKSKLSEAELAVLDSVITVQKPGIDSVMAFSHLQQDPQLQETSTSQPEFTTLTIGENSEAHISVSQESMDLKSPYNSSLEHDIVPQTIKSKDSEDTKSDAYSTLSSKETDSMDQIIKTENVQELSRTVQFPQQNGQSLSPIQSVLSAELTADAGGGGGNIESGSNIQHIEDNNKRLDVHHITDVNKRVADVVSSMASTLESITAAAEGFEGGHGSSDEGELMLMRDSPRWEDEEIQADEHEEPRAIKAEIKLLVKTTELGKESIEIRSIREFVETDDRIKCGFGGIMPSPLPNQLVESSSAEQVTPSGERVYTLQRESTVPHSSSPRFVRLHPTTGSTEESTHDDFDLMAQVRGSSGRQK